MFYLIAVPITAVIMTVALFFAEMFSDAELNILQKLVIAGSCACVYFIPFVGGWAAILLCAFLLKNIGQAESFGASLMIGFLMVAVTRLLFVFAIGSLIGATA